MFPNSLFLPCLFATQYIHCFAVMILEILFALLVVTAGYILVDYLIHLMRLKKYPPGPWPLPIIGNLHLIRSQPHKVFHELAKKYGPVMSFSFGTQRMVVIQGIKEAKDMLVAKGQSFAGMRQLIPIFLMQHVIYVKHLCFVYS